LIQAVQLDPRAAFITAFSYGGFTTNLPIPDLVNDQAFIACQADGKPLTPEHGGPARLVVPHLYFWKSAKWIQGFRLEEREQLELRGPIGGYFIWDIALGGPLLLIGGGSGVVPLMAMIRHRVAARSSIQTRLLYSVRSPDDVLYTNELQMLQDHGEGVEVVYTYTRQAPAGWTGYRRRIDRSMLKDITSQME